MKKCVVIANFHSGMKQRKKAKLDFDKMQDIFHKYDYNAIFYETEYPLHAKEIVESLKNDVKLVVSIGGDGTFNEVVNGNLNRKKRLLLSHLPYGTTNDIGTMFSLTKSVFKSLDAILSGKIYKIDVAKVNDRAFVYVSGFGKFMNIPYETPRNLKKKIGYGAYLIEALKDFFRKGTNLYDLTYEIDGEVYHGLYSFALISNANRIAGINNFYKDVHLNDKKFEILFCNIKSKKDIIKSLFYLKTSDITKVPGFYFHKTDHVKITFSDELKKAWCLDGEKYKSETNVYDIRVIPGLEMLLPKNVSRELFVREK